MDAVNIAPEVTAEVAESAEPQESSSKASGEVGSISDFEAWLSAKESKAEPKKEEGKKDEKPKDIKEPKDENKPEEPKKELPSEGKEEPKPGTPASIKVGDKEFKVEDIEAKFKEFDSLSEELNTVRSQAQQLVDMLQKDPAQIFDHINLPKEVIEKWYYETHMIPSMMTPEQRQARADRTELDKLRKVESERSAKEEQVKSENLRKKYHEEFSTKIKDALTKTGLPVNEWSISQTARHLSQELSNGNNQATPESVAMRVKQDWAALQSSILQGMNTEQLAAHLGKDVIVKLREHDIANLENKAFKPIEKAVSKPTEKKDKDKKPRFKNLYDGLPD